jgi:hypothetical protein
MNLFKELVLSAPVSNRLQFGHNENVIINAVDTSVRKIKGLPIKANTFITITQVDPTTRKAIAQNEFNFFNLDPLGDYVESNFIDEFTTLYAIVNAMGLSVEDFETKVLSVCSGNEPESMLKTKDGAKAIQDSLTNSFYEIVKDSLGDKCPLLKCKLNSNKKAYLEMGRVAGWILPMSSDEQLPEVSVHEVKARAEALNASAAPKQAKPDETGAAKPAVATAEKPVASAIGFGGL